MTPTRFLTPRSLRSLALAAALLLPLVPGWSLAARPRNADEPPPGIRFLDLFRRLDVSQMNMAMINDGIFAFDPITASGGLVWPKGSDMRMVFSSGLWLGCRVNGQTRVALAEYSSEYGPGGMVGGTFDDPERPEHRTYKVAPWLGFPDDLLHRDRTADELIADPLLDPLDHHAWSEYMAGAAPFGAPTRVYVLPDSTTPDPTDSVTIVGPDVLGDRMLWEVHNDADPARHINFAGGTLPLGVEIQQTAFAFNRADGLGDIVFLRFRILNKGGNTLDDLFVSLWSDPDVGGFTDDLTGCDIPRALGFAYNATNNDPVYGIPPAVGYVLLRGPTDPASGVPRGMTSFVSYINGTDPTSAQESYHSMQGLLPDGSEAIDPTTGQPTRYFFPGTPENGTGWLDSFASDRRFLIGSGPVRMLSGETQEVWAAIVVGRGPDRLSSVALVRCLADLARTLFQQNFAAFPPLPPLCSPQGLVNCPKTPTFWSLECQAGGAGHLSLAQLDSVGLFVSQQSTLFDWPIDPRAQFCGTVNPPGSPDLRQQARREFAAFLGNYAGGLMDLTLIGGQRIFLNPITEVSCPPLRALTIEQLAQPASLSEGFQDGLYLDHVPDHGVPLTGVNAGLGGFGGGAGPAFYFFGSPLDPFAQPDSFVTVEVRFDHTATQQAYRYLRLERQSDAGPPPQGRGYLFAGFHTVPFTCWDVEHNVQLDVGFVERTFTDDSGTILAEAFQPATRDSTWLPDDTEVGGREYLFVMSRPYSSIPKGELMQDGIILDGSAPALYALWSRRLEASSVIDDGDAFQFVWGTPPSPGADSLLVALEGQPLSDPAVQQAYQDVIHCLSLINQGIGIGTTCESGPTPVLVSLVSAEAGVDRVSLRWYADGPGLAAMVERRAGGGDWVAIGSVTADGEGYLTFEDRDVRGGTRYDYRLAVGSGAGVEYMGEVRVDVPGHDVLAFLGARSLPGDGRIAITFSLASREPARLEVLDVAGRRIVAQELTGWEPGSHTLELTQSKRFPSGIYLVRILQGRARVTGKVALVR